MLWALKLALYVLMSLVKAYDIVAGVPANTTVDLRVCKQFSGANYFRTAMTVSNNQTTGVFDCLVYIHVMIC